MNYTVIAESSMAMAAMSGYQGSGRNIHGDVEDGLLYTENYLSCMPAHYPPSSGHMDPMSGSRKMLDMSCPRGVMTTGMDGLSLDALSLDALSMGVMKGPNYLPNASTGSSAEQGSTSPPSVGYMLASQSYLLSSVQCQQLPPFHHQFAFSQEQQQQPTSQTMSPSAGFTVLPSAQGYAPFTSTSHGSGGIPTADNQSTQLTSWNAPTSHAPASGLSTVQISTHTPPTAAWANPGLGREMVHMQSVASATTMSMAATSAVTTSVAPTPSTVSSVPQSPMPSSARRHSRQGHAGAQRLRQQKNQQLQIMTSLESGIASMYPNQQQSGDAHPMSATSPQSSMSSPSIMATNSQSHGMSMTAANRATPGSHPHPHPHPHPHHYSWGFASSPVESSFTSGSSTPSFASLSPSLSYSTSDFSGASCDSSRATSPSFAHSPAAAAAAAAAASAAINANEGYFSERPPTHHALEPELSKNILESRKSSTSSISSIGSQRRMSALRESVSLPTSPSVSATGSPSIPASAANMGSPTSTAMSGSSSSSGSNKCHICGLCFAGPAVLTRHVESIHERLLWNCVGCKSNLSRRDAVTRHINLSPMDSICRAVGTIGQVKSKNGTDTQLEVSVYRAKPLEEVMSRMGKKTKNSLTTTLGAVSMHGGMIPEMNETAEYEVDENGMKKRRRASHPTIISRKK